MGTENQTSGGDFGSLLAGLGIDASTLSGGVNLDPNDRDLIWDRQNRTPGKGEFTMQEEAQFLYGGMPSDYTRVFPQVMKESEAQKHLYNRKDPTEVTELQRRLWAGGFYPPGTKQEDIIPGMPDYYTEKAWLNLIDRSAKYKNSGKDMSLWEVLDEGANILKAQGKEPGADGSGRQPLVTELANPEDLRYIANKTAAGVLGRALRPDELERFVSSFHGSQASAQQQAYNQAGATGGTTVSPPSPTAAAATFARQADPTAAGAHDFVKVYDVVARMLGGRRSS